MFNFGKSKKKADASVGLAPSLLGEGTHWQGEIQAGPEGLCVEGFVEGTIECTGQVTIAPSGVVKGAIHARNLTVRGRVEGLLKVDECLEILGTGWVEGEVELATLVVDEGATLQGSCVNRPIIHAKEPMLLVPRKEERVGERLSPTGTGTVRPSTDYLHTARSLGRKRS